MTAVIAAIVAAAIAGGIALYRERRIELTRLLVAARVLSAEMARVGMVVDGGAEMDQPKVAGAVWLLDEFVESGEPLTKAWEGHREVLAAHLRAKEWEKVERAIRSVALLKVMVGAERDAEHARSLIVGTAHDLHASADLLFRYSKWTGILFSPGRVNRHPPHPSINEISAERVRCEWQKRMADREKDRERGNTRH
jgi:hypothetical protein